MILSFSSPEDIVNRISIRLPEICDLAKRFAEVTEGRTYEEIKKDSETLEIISKLYSKECSLNSDLWILDKLVNDNARQAKSREEWEDYSRRILGDK